MSEELEIVPVQDGRLRREFIGFPYRLYRRDPYWVAPLRLAQKQLLDTRKHPFWAHAEMQAYLARRSGRVVGRVAAILDHSFIQFHGEQAGLFGFFECQRDSEAASALLEAARQWLRGRGAEVIRGPLNPSTNYECGLLVEGFDSSPYIMMPYNPPYYAELLEGAGLRKAMDLYAYYLHKDFAPEKRLEGLARRALETNHIRIRPIRLDRFEAEAEVLWELYQAVWQHNWGFAPMSRDEFLFMAREFKPIAVPDLVLVGEREGRPVGFALALPDINRALKHARGRLFPLGLLKILYHKRTVKSIRVIALGVREEFRSAGVAAGFYAELVRRGPELGYPDGEMSWVLEDNVLANRSMEALGGKRYKTYRIYQWK